MKNNQINIEHRFKKLIDVCVMFLLVLWFLFLGKTLQAQTDSRLPMPDQQIEPIVSISDVDSETPLDTLVIEPVDGNAYAGIIFGSDLNFEKASRMDYRNNYGAYVERVEPDGPAYLAGIQAKDIITSFDSEKVLYNDHLVRLIRQHHPGDTVPVILFRDGKMMTTRITLAIREEALPPKPEIVKTVEIKHAKPESFSGMWAWDIMAYLPDSKDLFMHLEELGYPTLLTDYELNDKVYTGMHLNGFYFETGDQNNTITWGILWAGGDSHQQRIGPLDNREVERSVRYSMNYWGIKVNARIPITHRIFLNPAVLGGFLESELKFYQPDPEIVWDQLSQRLATPGQQNLTVNRKYLIVQPSIALILRIGDALGLQLQGGYFFGKPRQNGWTVTTFNSKKEILNSPNSSIGGYTFSIGPCLIFD